MTVPVIVGAAEYTQNKDVKNRLDPLRLMEISSRGAISNGGVRKIIDYIDTIYMVNISSWSYFDAPGDLAKILGIGLKNDLYLQARGDSPQFLVNEAAKTISRDETGAILITGGESEYSSFLASKRKIKLEWPRKKNAKKVDGHIKAEDYDLELKYQLTIPSYIYAILETALRNDLGYDLKKHAENMGEILERFSKIASTNPNSWIQESYQAQEIFTPSEENRKITHPYTKRMCANMYVDQTASIIITSEAIANELKIDKKKWVYPMGGSTLENHCMVTRRPSLTDSPAIKLSTQLALKQAGLTLKEIDMFDFYSCFPYIIELAMKELGISNDDKRQLTITGGLPYFGGPWANYSMHAISKAVKLIRDNPKLRIMVLANGGYNSYESIGVYGTAPPKESWNERDDSKIQEAIFNQVLPPPIEQAIEGLFTVEGYTIPFDRDNKPRKVIFLGRTNGSPRTYAILEANQDILLDLERQELVGRQFKIKYDPNTRKNVVSL